jgi:hypothetical protein
MAKMESADIKTGRIKLVDREQARYFQGFLNMQ